MSGSPKLIHIAAMKCLTICQDSSTPFSALRDCSKELEGLGWRPTDVEAVEAWVAHLLIQTGAPLPGVEGTRTWP